MKSIYNKQNIKFFIAGLALILVASLGFFVQSCSQDDTVSNIIDDSSNAQFLDLDVTRNTLFTPKEIEIIAYASHRIITHMIFDSDNNKYVFGLQSPAEINVSERLFNYIYPGVEMKPNLPRLKGDDMECVTSSGWGWTQTKCYMNDADMVQVLDALSSAYSQASYNLNWLALALTKYPLLAGAIAFYSQAISAQGMTIDQSYHQYLQGNRRGGTATETRVSVPNAGYVTTYQFSF